MRIEASVGPDPGAILDARILVVDDEPANVRLMERLLARAGYTRVRGTQRSDAVVPCVAEFCPDLILLDVHMPGKGGLELLQDLLPWTGAPARVPVIMLTADADAVTRQIALERGARDFVQKPLEMQELLLRIRNVLETRWLQLEMERHARDLEHTVKRRSEDLQEAQLELVERLARAAEYRDDETHEHAQRVGRTAALIARRLGLSDDEVALIERAAPLHDVGKIGIADAVFLKPGALTDEEFATMRLHVPVGANILAGSSSPVLRLAEEIVSTHHERWDGTGYPAGLRGTDIPLVGRIVAVADVFDALTHVRPYKAPWSLERAALEIASSAGEHFDPGVVEAFLTLDHAYLLAPIAVPSAMPEVSTPVGMGSR